MSDLDRWRKLWCERDHWGIAMAVAANLAVIGALAGVALLLLLGGIYALHWLEALPCLCV